MVKPTLRNIKCVFENKRFPTAPIPSMSAPMFNTIAGKLNTTIQYRMGFE